jgi:hypothetical protein
MGLKYGVNVSSDVRKLAKELKEEYKLSDFESLTLALKAERNELFKLAFVISSSDSYPSALEKIAMLLENK